LPDSNALSQHQSVMTYATLPVNNDSSVSKRLIICLLAALRANGINITTNFIIFIKFKYLIYLYVNSSVGSFGVHVPLRTKDQQTLEFYTKLGFMEISQGPDPNTGFTYLGRVF